MEIDRMTTVLTEDYKTKANVTVIPIGLIATLVELALSLISSCLAVKPHAFAEKPHPVIARIRIRQAMRRSGLISRPDSEAIVETLYGAMEGVTEVEFVELAQGYNSF